MENTTAYGGIIGHVSHTHDDVFLVSESTVPEDVVARRYHFTFL